MEEKSIGLAKNATSDPATARLGIFAAGPERADEGGGPTPGRLRWEQRVEKSHLGRLTLLGRTQGREVPEQEVVVEVVDEEEGEDDHVVGAVLGHAEPPPE